MPNKYLSGDRLQICNPLDNRMHHSQVQIAFIIERCKVRTIMIYIGLLLILFLCATSNTKGQQTKVNTPKQTSKQIPAKTTPAKSDTTNEQAAVMKQPLLPGNNNDSISGDWDGIAQFPGLPPVQIKLKLKLDGKKVGGELIDSPTNLPVSSGIWDNNKLTLNFPAAVMTATIKGGKLVGEQVTANGMKKGTWEARQKKNIPSTAKTNLPNTLPELLTLIQNELEMATATEGKE